MADRIHTREDTTMDTTRLTEQDVTDARFASRYNDEAAREWLGEEANVYDDEANTMRFDDALYRRRLAEYENGKRLLTHYRLVSTRRKDATLDAYAEIDALTRRHAIVSPWVRCFAGYVATTEQARWYALAQR